MNDVQINELKEICYAIGSSKFPLDTFFNDIRDNIDPRFDKIRAYEDLKLIVDVIYPLIKKSVPMKPKNVRIYYNCRGGNYDTTFQYHCPVCNTIGEDSNYCYNCGQKLDWSEKDKYYE